MKKIILFSLMVIGTSIVLNAQSKDEKKRLKIIEKSLKKNCVAIYKDTVYYSGEAALLIETQPNKSEKIYSLSNQPLFVMEIANTQTTASVTALMKSISFLFWVKFEGRDETIRYFSKGSYAELIQEFIETGLLKDGILESNALNNIINEFQAAKVNYNISSNCGFPVKIVVRNSKQEIIEDYSIQGNYNIAHEAAIGDKLCMVDEYGEPLSCIEIKADGKVILVNSYCTGLVEQ